MAHKHPSRGSVVFAAAVTLIVGLTVPSAVAAQAPARQDAPASAAPHIDVNDVLPHLQKLQSIADANGGHRSQGTKGYAQSVDYVAKTLTAAGYQVKTPQCTTCTGSKDHFVIADVAGGDPNSTIMFGAHVDSVSKGPGIEDDGSGTAGLLQTALAVAKARPKLSKHVRFVWFADEEQQDDASTYYVDKIGTKDLEAYINLDMIAAPNAGYFLTHIDSKYGKAMAAYLKTAGVPAEQTKADCDCADDQAFADAGVPTTYLATASNDTDNMNSEQAEKWNGKKGKPWDACYHQACDSYPKNINTKVLDYTTNDIVQALWSLAVTAQG